MDAIYLIVVILFFIATLGLLQLCDRLMGGES